MTTTLLVGGTGPTGQRIVRGLIDRGHQVKLLHTGQHEVDLPEEVEHIHTDPHFAESLGEALAGRSFDQVIATYGRVRIVAEVVADKTDRLITASGSSYAGGDDPRWGPLGAPMLAREGRSPKQEFDDGRAMPFKVWRTEQHLLQMHAEGRFNLTIMRYPSIYGPGSPANPDWSVVRRVLEKRPYLLLSEDGLRVRNRGFGPNVAQAVLLAVDQPEVSAGRVYDVADTEQYSERAVAEFIAHRLGHEFEIIGIPPAIAHRLRPEIGKFTIGYSAFHTGAIERELGYVDSTPIAEAMAQSVDWLVRNPIGDDTEVARQIGDDFDYELEDRLAAIYSAAQAQAANLDYKASAQSHMYRHPSKPFQTWSEATADRPRSDQPSSR